MTNLLLNQLLKLQFSQWVMRTDSTQLIEIKLNLGITDLQGLTSTKSR